MWKIQHILTFDLRLYILYICNMLFFCANKEIIKWVKLRGNGLMESLKIWAGNWLHNRIAEQNIFALLWILPHVLVLSKILNRLAGNYTIINSDFRVWCLFHPNAEWAVSSFTVDWSPVQSYFYLYDFTYTHANKGLHAAMNMTVMAILGFRRFLWTINIVCTTQYK